MLIENMTPLQMWGLAIAITVLYIVACIIFKEKIKLGARAFVTWDVCKINKLHNECGGFLVVISTLVFGMCIIGAIRILAIWIGIILWTLNLWTPAFLE